MHSGREVNVVVTREDVERAAWAASGWSVEQSVVDELMAAVDAYVVDQLEFVPVVEPATVKPDEPVSVAAVTLEEPEPAPEPVVAVEPAPGEGEKPCTRCGLVKPLDAFGRDKTTRSGYKARCKKCLAEVKKAWKERQVAAARTPGDAP